MTEEEKRLVMSRILTGRKPQGPYSMPSSTFEPIYEEYPRLRSGDYRLVVDPELMGGQGNIEFIGAGYSTYPEGPVINEDNPTIALRSLESNPNLQRRLLGDMLHNLPETDEKFSEMKQGFIKSMTPEQMALDKKVYKKQLCQKEVLNTLMAKKGLMKIGLTGQDQMLILEVILLQIKMMNGKILIQMNKK